MSATEPVRQLRTGKRPAQPARRQLRAHTFLSAAALPDPPTTVDHLGRVPSWPMYANDQWGDCVFAGIGHQEQQVSLFGQGAEVRVSDADVLGGYATVTGFNAAAGPPGRNPTDQGTYTQDAMTWWRNTGIAGHRILAYASIDPDNTRLIQQCIALFGAVGVGFNFPRSAMDQFDAGKPWDVVARSPLDGGHYVIAGAYGPGWWDTITWARRQRMTAAFWAKYVDEVWLVIDDEMADLLTGRTSWSGGVDLYALGQAFQSLTGETSPITTPTPVTPTPTPTPTSGLEPATAADRALWTPARQVWAGNTRTSAEQATRRSLREWAAKKSWS